MTGFYDLSRGVLQALLDISHFDVYGTKIRMGA
jgi:hypothetical protein